MNANDLEATADVEGRERGSDSPDPDERKPYAAPRIVKKQSLVRVTLFSGGTGGPAIGLTSSG
jgi:hypothetical protein